MMRQVYATLMKGAVQLSNEEYHSKNEYSKSDLDAAHKSGIHLQYKKEGPKQKPTPAMRIGSAFHALVLEPDVFENEFIYKPEILNARSKDGKEWKARQEEAGRTVLSEDDKEQLQAMTKSLLACKPAYDLLNADGIAEQSFFWKNEQTGLDCKCRPDYLFEDGSTIVDVKTTTDASLKGFSRSVCNFRYHVQAGFYLHGIEQATGVRPDRFIFLAIEKTAPYGVGVYEADSAMVTNGFEQAMIDLQKIEEWKRTENYTGYTEEIQQISLPAWMSPKKNNTVLPSMDDIVLF